MWIPHRWVVVFYGASLLATTCVDAAAVEGQSKMGPALEPGQAPSGRMMRGELLRRCRTLDDEIQQLDIRIQVLQSTMDVYSRAIDSKGAELDALHATLDTSDGDAVASYNRKVESQHADIARHDALLPEHNELTRRQNPRVDEFNEKCAGLSYFRKEWNNVTVEPDPGLMPPATEF